METKTRSSKIWLVALPLVAIAVAASLFSVAPGKVLAHFMGVAAN